MSQLTLIDVSPLGDKIQFTYSPCPPEQLAQAVLLLMQREGYRLEEGNPMNAVYGIGDKTLRLLFGAFVKRYAFHIVIGPGINNQVVLQMGKAMSGFSGGVIGVAKLKKEMERMQFLLRGLY